MWLRSIAVVGALAAALLHPGLLHGQALKLSDVNAAEFSPAPAKPAKPAKSSKSAKPPQATKGPNPVVLKAQVLLDRAGFSPGAIDAIGGENFEKALAAFQRHNELNANGTLDEQTWSKLKGISTEPVLITYEIQRTDIKGPFTKSIPQGFEKMALLKRLSYTGPRELLAEKFHLSEELLQALNPRSAFKKAGVEIVVANVARNAPKEKAAKIEVNKTERALRALDAEGKLIAYYPASTGSEEKPAPSGSFQVRAIAENPTYEYNPAFAFKEVKTKKKLTIPAGPNNPVGAVWIDLTAESYGIHGTPSPEKVSKTFSHGCIRLTNWDVKALAKMVGKGTPVDFIE